MSKKFQSNDNFEEEGHFSHDKIFIFSSDDIGKEIKISARLSFLMHNSKFLELSIKVIEGLELLTDLVVLDISHNGFKSK